MGSSPEGQVLLQASSLVTWLPLPEPHQIWARSATQVRARCLISGYAIYTRAVLADADPLGVNQNVTFDEVGGLDERACIILRGVDRVLTPRGIRHQLFEGDDPSALAVP